MLSKSLNEWSQNQKTIPSSFSQIENQNIAEWLQFFHFPWKILYSFLNQTNVEVAIWTTVAVLSMPRQRICSCWISPFSKYLLVGLWWHQAVIAQHHIAQPARAHHWLCPNIPQMPSWNYNNACALSSYARFFRPSFIASFSCSPLVDGSKTSWLQILRWFSKYQRSTHTKLC